MRTTSRIAIVAVLAIVVAVVVMAKRRNTPPPAAPAKPAVADATQKPVARLLCLGSKTCIPCKAMEPVRAELAKEHQGRLTVDFVDVRETPGVGEAYGIRVIPTAIFYDAAGKELTRFEGFISKADIVAKFKESGVDLVATRN